MAKNNIWLWNHYAIRMCEDKAGRQFWFSEKLVEQGYKTTVFCANTYHGKKDFIDTGKQKYIIKHSDNTPFVFVKTTPGIGNGIERIKNMFLFYKNLFPVSKAYAKSNGKPDVIIASSVHPLTMIAGIKIARKFNIPCICEVRDLWPEAIFAFGKAKENSLLGKLLVAGEHWIYKNADAIIFTKEGDIDYIKERRWDTKSGGDIELEKCYYINNGIDLEYFIKSANENNLEDPDLSDDKFNVVYTGTIRSVNNIGMLLDVANLLKEYPDIQILIYGVGDQLEKLKQRVVTDGLFNVKLKGYVKRQFIPYILSKSSVNILNYSQAQYNWTRGNSSNKLFEYMASGKPIISTVRMGYSIIDKYQCGLELEKATPRELADTILRVKGMSKEEYQKTGNNAKKGAEDFDFKVLTEKLINVISIVLEGQQND